MRLALFLLTLTLSASQADAQRLGKPLIARDVEPGRAAITPETFTKQMLSGLGGAAVGAVVVGGFADLMLGPRASLGTIEFSALGGAAFGGATGVALYSRRAGMRAPFLAPLAGAAVGTLGITAGPAVFVTVPLGASLGFHLARRE